MKHLKILLIRLLLLFSLVTLSGDAFSQNLISKSVDPMSTKVSTHIRDKIGAIRFERININIERIENEELSIDFMSFEFALKKRKLDRRGLSDFSLFAGQEYGMNRMILSVLDDDIQGYIFYGLKTYVIRTVFGEYVIYQVDEAAYPMDCALSKHELYPHEDDTLKYDISAPSNVKSKGRLYKGTYPNQDPWNYECKLRILVMYTTGAKNEDANIENTIRLSIDLLNECLYNTSIPLEAELVHVLETGYSEDTSVIENDADRFAIDGDNIMDTVHDLRERYSADYCALFTASGGDACGIASAIKSCQSHSFCVLRRNCAVDKLSFPHEIGHLIGGRHNPTLDPATTPFAYGHGFIDPQCYYKTIMGVFNSCSPVPDRIPMFSSSSTLLIAQASDGTNISENPGTSGSHDMERMIEERTSYLLALRPNSGQYLVTQEDVNSTQYGVLFHRKKILSNDTITITDSFAISFVANESIELNPGFETQYGSYFEAYTITSCGVQDPDTCNFQPGFDPWFDANVPLNFRDDEVVKIYPIPSDLGFCHVLLSEWDESTSYAYILHDYLGRIIQEGKLPSRQSIISLKRLDTGIAYLSLIQNGRTLGTYPIMINNK